MFRVNGQIVVWLEDVYKMVSTVLRVIFFASSTGVLIAGEVGVENIALHADAKALKEIFDARRAVDGNSDPHFYRNSCTHTRIISEPWWMVDLGSLSEVRSVDITNRGGYCWERLSNFTIQMSQELEDDQVTLRDRSLCGHYHPGTVGDGATVKFECPGPVYARYVKVQIHSPAAVLTLCEVKVWGVKPAPALPDCPAYTAIQGRKSPALVLEETIVPTVALCGIRCRRTKHCYSFNVQANGSSFTCELLEDIRELICTDVMAGASSVYFRVLLRVTFSRVDTGSFPVVNGTES